MGLPAKVPGAHFALSLGIKNAHRRLASRQEDWGLQSCRARRPYLWINRVGTFGMRIACYWWSRLAGMLSRLAGALTGKDWFWQLVFADDIKWTSRGPREFENIRNRCKACLGEAQGGMGLVWIGYWLDYFMSELGIIESRVGWIIKWQEGAVAVHPWSRMSPRRWVGSGTWRACSNGRSPFSLLDA